MKIFSIGDIKIGANVVPLVIPEIGINHNGSLDVAKLMVDSEYNAGARLIKHQTHVIDDEMTHEAKTVIPGNTNKSIYEVMKDAALSEDDEWQLMKYVESKNMEYLSTPFSKAAADRLESFGVKGYKIGSGEMNNYPLLKYVASFGKPMIVSTGMNDLKSVNKTVNILKSFEIPFALLHTTNIYPTPPQLVRLGAMKQLIDEYQDIPVGLSDHTINNNACIAAIGLGATIVERH
ncbi:MAG: N-acetylneuraminate synthase family protein, partial [Candidatus Methanomethylophilus sp.]|nr:N-acetylneuraminate synthase family protein [Methanomethylophilus sp.]